ncbi:hypothetical protein Bca4012_050667 [Brassica carinata]
MQRIGVVGAITSWNFPLAMITRKVGPALASGCTVVIKPSQLMPLTALAAAEFALQAGAPVRYDFRLEPLTILIDCFVSFDGSCCIYCKKVSLELGGNPSIIFDDADLDVVVKATLSDSHQNSGQTCVCANRVLVVQRTPLWILHLVSISIFFSTGIYDKFAEAFSEAVQKLEVGDGFKEGTPRYGPFLDLMLISSVFVVLFFLKRAKIILGGKRHSLGMTFYEALLLSLIIVLRICFLGRRFSDQKLSESLMTLLQDLLLIYSQTVSNDRGVSLKHLSAGL